MIANARIFVDSSDPALAWSSPATPCPAYHRDTNQDALSMRVRMRSAPTTNLLSCRPDGYSWSTTQGHGESDRYSSPPMNALLLLYPQLSRLDERRLEQNPGLGHSRHPEPRTQIQKASGFSI